MPEISETEVSLFTNGEGEFTATSEIYGVKKVDNDFIGFTFNGVHSDELGIKRTSNGDRYVENITPTFRDVIQPAVGHDGAYLISSYAGPREFTVDFAFDHLTEEQLHKLSLVFDGLGVHELIFDEWPYKVYDAKVKGTPTIKYVPFDYYQWEGEGENKTQRKETIYKGEGSISFICYYPYAHTPTQEKEINNYWGGSGTVTIDGKCAEYYLTEGQLEEFYKYLTENENPNYEEYCNNWKNEFQWLESSGILPAYRTIPLLSLINQGDIPAPFIYEMNAVQTSTQSTPLYNGIFDYYVLNNNIFILEDCSNLIWNSRTGLIIGTVEGTQRPIKYEGNALARIGRTTYSANHNVTASLTETENYTYSYWYY